MVQKPLSVSEFTETVPPEVYADFGPYGNPDTLWNAGPVATAATGGVPLREYYYATGVAPGTGAGGRATITWSFKLPPSAETRCVWAYIPATSSGILRCTAAVYTVYYGDYNPDTPGSATIWSY